MKPIMEDILRAALKLVEADRAEVAAQLLESLELAEAEAVWLTELESRAAELESGGVQGIPWEDLRESPMHNRWL